MSDADIVALLRGALHKTAPSTAIQSTADAEPLTRFLSAAARFVGAADLVGAARVAESSIRSLVAADLIRRLR